MDWFKRYGIPGAYSMGLTLVWLIILYPCRIDLREEATLKIVVGIFAGGFLPFGYLMFLVGQVWYFLRCCCSNRYGRHARARLIAEAVHANNVPVNISDWAKWAAEGIHGARNGFIRWVIKKANKIIEKLTGKLAQKETVLAACSILASVSNCNKLDLKKDKYIQEWIRKRTDIVVMNQSIMAETILCTIGVWFLKFLPGWSIQSLYWRWLLIPVLFLLLIIIVYVTAIFRIKIDIVIAGVFNLRRR